MWTFQPVRFRARLSWPYSRHPPPPPFSLSLSLSLSLIPLSGEAFWRTTNFFLYWHTTNNDRIYDVARIFRCTFQCWRSWCEAVDAALYPTRFCLTRFSSQPNRFTPALLLSSLPSPLPPHPHHRETCAGLFMLFRWHFHPRSEARSRRVGTGSEAGVTDELNSTRLALKLAPWRGSSLVSMARHKSCVHPMVSGPSVRLLEPSWWEVNPRNTSVPGAVSAFSWTSIAKTKVSQHTCVFDSMWTFQPVRFRARLSWPLHTPPPPPPPSQANKEQTIVNRTAAGSTCPAATRLLGKPGLLHTSQRVGPSPPGPCEKDGEVLIWVTVSGGWSATPRRKCVGLPRRAWSKKICTRRSPWYPRKKAFF